MAYPRNRPNRSSFFVGYQPAGNLDTEPLWRLAGARLGMGRKSAQTARKEPSLEIDGLPNDLEVPEQQFNAGLGAWRKALSKYGGDTTMAANSAEGRKASSLMSVPITDRADIKRGLEEFGPGSQWAELLKERSGDAYLPGGLNGLQLDRNGNIMTRDDVHQLRMSQAGAIQNQRASGQYITPYADSSTSEDAYKFIRETFGSASVNENSAEGLNPAATGLFEYYRTTTKNSNNIGQIKAARENMKNALPDGVRAGMFQDYNSSGAHNAFLADYQEKPPLDENGKPVPLREATLNNFMNNWLPGRIDEIMNEYVRSSYGENFAKIDGSSGGADSNGRYENWAGIVQSDVPIPEATQGSMGISIPAPNGDYNYFNVPSQEIAGGSFWFEDAMTQLPKVQINPGSKDSPSLVRASDLFSGTRIMINQNDGLVSNTDESDLLRDGYVHSIGSGVRAFPKNVMGALRTYLQTHRKINSTDINKIVGLAVPQGMMSNEAAQELEPLRKEARNLIGAALPMLEKANWNVDEMPSSFVRATIIRKSDQGFLSGASLTNHPYLVGQVSSREAGQRGGTLKKPSDYNLMNESEGIGIFGEGEAGELDSETPNSSVLTQRSQQISEELGAGFGAFEVLIGLRPEDETLPRNKPDKIQSQFSDERARNAFGVPAQRTIDPTQSLVK
jgi:hypothetical protein